TVAGYARQSMGERVVERRRCPDRDRTPAAPVGHRSVEHLEAARCFCLCRHQGRRDLGINGASEGQLVGAGAPDLDLDGWRGLLAGRAQLRSTLVPMVDAVTLESAVLADHMCSRRVTDVKLPRDNRG